MLSGKEKWQRPGKPTETCLVHSLFADCKVHFYNKMPSLVESYEYYEHCYNEQFPASYSSNIGNAVCSVYLWHLPKIILL